MRTFVLSLAAAVILALAFAYGLSTVQQSIANADIGSSVRLDRQEAVSSDGRQG